MSAKRATTSADEFWTRSELSSEIKVPVKTIANWASRKAGPPYIRIEGHVRYSKRAVLAWLAEHQVGA